MRQLSWVMSAMVVASVAGCNGCGGESGGGDTADLDGGVAEDATESRDGDAESVDAPSDGRADAEGDVDGGSDRVFSWNFDDGAQEWTASYTDYSEGMDVSFESGIRSLPDGLSESGTGYFVGGSNVSDDLFMFLKRKIGGDDVLEASTGYNLDYTIRFASDAPKECAGIGGPPGEAVYLKAGGGAVEPESVRQDGEFRLNVDKGNQSSGGEYASVVGNVATSNKECTDRKWEMLEKTHVHDSSVQTDENGQIWLLIGTDSGFEGRTKLYYREITVELTPVP